jgi:hypothetical protein
MGAVGEFLLLRVGILGTVLRSHFVDPAAAVFNLRRNAKLRSECRSALAFQSAMIVCMSIGYVRKDFLKTTNLTSIGFSIFPNSSFMIALARS